VRASAPRLRKPAAPASTPRKGTRGHNRLDAGRALLAEIEAWCERTGTYEGRLGQALFGAGGYVPLLRKRLTVSPEKEDAVRGFLTAFPDGIEGLEVEIRKWLADSRMHVPGDEPGRMLPAPPKPAKDRSGAMMLAQALQCEAAALTPPPALAEALRAEADLAANVAAAARMEGASVWDFVVGLIRMGFDCWRDDREIEAEVDDIPPGKDPI
jgi:hypothetical protein